MSVWEKVWYRSRPVGLAEPAIRAMQDVGVLTVEHEGLVFVGETRRVEVRDAKSVSQKRHGRDFVNRWITVEYGELEVAMFVDGRLRGWRGIFGGNRRLYAEVLKTLGPDAGDG